MLKRTKKPALKRTKPMTNNKIFCYPCQLELKSKYDFAIKTDDCGFIYCKHCNSLLHIGFNEKLIKPLNYKSNE